MFSINFSKNYFFSEKMPTSIQLEFTLDEDELTKNFKTRTHGSSDFDCLELINVPTTQLGIDFICNNVYDEILFRNRNIFGIIFKINEEVDENFHFVLEFPNFRFQPSFLVAFQSNVGNHGVKIYWKSSATLEFHSTDPTVGFYSIYIDGDITSMVYEFLLDEIKARRSGETNVYNYYIHELL